MGKNPAGSTTVTVTNRTPYTLQVNLDGPSFQSMTLASGQSRVITVTPGTYRETAQALSSNVAGFSGTQTFSSGNDYSQTFVVG